MNCPHCGEEIEDNSDFCRECLSIIDEDDLGDNREDSDANPSLLPFSIPSVSRRFVVTSILLILLVTGLFGLASAGLVSMNDIQGGIAEVTDRTSAVVNDRVTSPANESVIEINQLDLGWKVDGSGEVGLELFFSPVFTQDIPNDAYYTAFTKEETNEQLVSIAAVMESSNEASNQYDDYAANASSEYSTENVSVGEEGLVYTDGGATVIVFRDRNVIGVIVHTTGTNRPAVDRTLEYAELMRENIE